MLRKKHIDNIIIRNYLKFEIGRNYYEETEFIIKFYHYFIIIANTLY